MSLESIKKELVNQIDELGDFIELEINNLSEKSQLTRLSSINKFFRIVGYKNIEDLSIDDIKTYIKDKNFLNLKNSSKNINIFNIGKMLEFYNREGLVDKFPNYNEKEKELNKNELISRDDLEKLLKSCNSIKHKLFIMLLYESACRKKEILGIKKKDLVFKENYVNLYIHNSKTINRNIPLVESMPYIKEYFNKYNPRENEILFDYADTYPNALLNRINKRTKKKFKDYNKDIYPHLFRHSRLTELANNRLLNEPQLRKFAGWSKSSDMPSIYFHLDDESLRKELINQEPKKKEKISFNKNNIRCPNCSEINNKINAFCWKCGKVLNEELASKKFKEEQKIKQKIKKLKNENEKLKSQMNKIKEENKDIKDFLGEFSKLKKEISEFKEWKQDHDEYQRYLEVKKAEKEANKKRY